MEKTCTVAIAVWNSLKATRQCLESLVLHTDYPYKALVIDNGSGADTRAFLEDFCRGRDNFRIKRFEENTGYLPAANFALETAETPYICLLNNDTILADGWLGECVSILGSRDDVGIVSPTTNELSRKFRERLVSGKIKEYKGKSIEVNSCLGSCFILKREVVAKVGCFDPVYGTGYFEEVDYCFRARAGGFGSRLALGAYIEHLGNTSFGVLPQEREALWRRNRDILESRWGGPERILVFLKKRYGEDVLARAREFLLARCRKRAIIELYSSDGGAWAEGLHFNIRLRRTLLYNRAALYLTAALKKKAYDRVITDIRASSLNGFCDFAGLETLYADADPSRGPVHNGPDHL